MKPETYQFLCELLRKESGLVLSADKHYLVETRLEPILRKSSIASLDELADRLRRLAPRDLREQVVEAMTTNESFFFRDKTPFELFENEMLPKLLEARSSARRLRIWCAAASTGQEPYSLAMLLKERAAKLGGWTIEILGTDLSKEVLEKAKLGIYSQFEVQRGLPIQLLLKYFDQKGDTWHIDPGIRQMVRWRHFNLLEPFAALGKFDIVFCRNVLIYFNPETKVDVLQRLAKVTAADGYMVLGSAETVVGLTDVFQPVADKRGLYQTRNVDGSGNSVTGLPKRPPLAAVSG